MSERRLRTTYGDWRELLYYDGRYEALALVFGDVVDGTNVPCRIHSACISAHVFNSIECDCRDQLAMAQSYIAEHGQGVVVWLDQEGRGNGHLALMEAAKLAEAEEIPQSEAYRSLGFPEENRSYRSAAAILRDLGLRSIELLSNSPEKAGGLRTYGVAVARTRSLAIDLKQHPGLASYYADKRSRGHQL